MNIQNEIFWTDWVQLHPNSDFVTQMQTKCRNSLHTGGFSSPFLCLISETLVYLWNFLVGTWMQTSVYSPYPPWHWNETFIPERSESSQFSPEMGKAHDELFKVDLPVPIVVKYINHSPGFRKVFHNDKRTEETWRGGFAATLVNSWTPRSTVSRTRPGPFWVDQIFGFQRFYGFTSGADISFTNYWFDVCIEILKFLWNKYGNAHWKRCSF